MMKTFIIPILVFYLTLAFAFPPKPPGFHSDHGLIPRGNRGNPGYSTDNEGRPVPHLSSGFSPSGGRTFKDWFRSIVSSKPKVPLVKTPYPNERPGPGNTAIFQYTNEKGIRGEIHVGDKVKAFASGNTYYEKANPSMRQRVYRFFRPEKRARDQQRAQTVAVYQKGRALYAKASASLQQGQKAKQENNMVRVQATREEYAQDMAAFHGEIMNDMRTKAVLMKYYGMGFDRQIQQPYDGPDHPGYFGYYGADHLQAHSVQVPENEAQQMRAMIYDWINNVSPNDGAEMTLHDNRSPSTLSEQASPEVGPQVAGWPKPVREPDTGSSPGTWFASKPNPSPNDPSQFSLLDLNPNLWLNKRTDLSKRQSPITSITNQEGNSAAGGNDTVGTQAEFQQYIDAFRAGQANVSDLIFPFLDTILNGTNSSIVYDAALSIYSDLTGSSPYVIGPFFHGMNCIEWVEDQIANSTAANISTPADYLAKLEYQAVHHVLLELYDYAYSNGSAAINQTGLLADMATLASYLSPQDMSVLPTNYKSYVAKSYDDAYFTTYNLTMPPDSTFSNVTFNTTIALA